MKSLLLYSRSGLKRVSDIAFLLVFFLSVSCRQSRELAYISDAQRDSAQAILSNYASTIHPGDQLYIYVYSQTPESAVPFNEESRTFAAEMSRNVSGEKVGDVGSMGRVRQTDGYLVTEDGFITFPVLGKLIAAGFTHDSLAHAIERHLIEGGYINDPIVTISPLNFRVSVVGEVRSPRELHITGNRLTILEAIAMCGDLTIDGQRENVTVLREIEGTTTPLEINLTSKTLFDSPAYYLQHNDIVYVEPNRKRKREAEYDPNIASYVSVGVSLVRTIYVFTRGYVWDRRGLF